MQNVEPTTEIPKPPLQVMLRGHFYSNLGYAKANRNFAMGLARAGVRINVDPVNDTIDGLNEIEIMQVNILKSHPNPDAILIDSTIPTFSKLTPCRYAILYTTVEAESVPKQFVQACDKYNEVWVTSDFCKDVLTKAGVTKQITVMPNSVNHRLYNEQAVPHHFIPPLKSFVFVSVFGWNYRKGYDLLLKAYCNEFSKGDDVSLLIVSKYGIDAQGYRKKKIEQEIRDYITQYGGDRPPHVARCGRLIPEFEMPRLYRACNAFVLPTRGEGFGLPFIESSLCGLPVIATKGSGQGMFLNDANSYLLPVDKVSAMPDGKTKVHYWDGEMFPEMTSDTTVKQLQSLMRQVYENEQAAKEKNTKLQQDILNKYTCEIVAEMAKIKMEHIWNNL